MEYLIELFPNLSKYLELFPILIMGILSGAVSYFNKDGQVGAIKEAIRAIITCAFLAVLCYAILAATDLPYLAKVGISCAIGYFGIDNTIDMVQKFISLKSNHKSENKA